MKRLFPLRAAGVRQKPFLMPVFLAALFLIPCAAAGSDAFSFNGRHEVLGTEGKYAVAEGESLYEIARFFDTGFNEITAANPGVDPILPAAGASIVLPTSWVLPAGNRRPGVVINLSEMRLYYYFKNRQGSFVRTYPIGIGVEGDETPLGVFRVVKKITYPAWTVPVSIRKERPELPHVMPPGPDNPLGTHALRLSRRAILIHGTNMPWGIGRRVSHGCIRLYPEDIQELFRLVRVNTRVTIVRQPVKIGVSGRHVYVDVSADTDLKSFAYSRTANVLLRKRGLMHRVDTAKLARAIRNKRGTPVDITRLR